ncbi:uncharacterized protein LOC135374241 [Ornithodoros turicata]|uniref:uncharacterized protein LOC135374241 n=1 Tax=Ornithodoros turicata TaxID=34597 RepID=UPI0031395E96
MASPLQSAATGAGIDATTAEPAIRHIAVRLPPFWPQNPTVWFLQVECQFSLASVTNQLTKFRHVVCVFPPDVAAQIADVLGALAVAPYDALKAAILDRTTASERKRIHQLLIAKELGDRRRSQLLRDMQALLGERAPTFDQALLKKLFFQRLPANVQMILATASDLQLPQLAAHADKIMEVSTPHIAAVSNAAPSIAEVLCVPPKLPPHTRVLHRHSSPAHSIQLRSCVRISPVYPS